MAPAEEIELLNRARAGEEHAASKLYSDFFANSRPVRALLWRQVSNPQDREDLLHEAYVSLLSSRSEFRGDSKLQTFVYRVVQIAILQKRRDDRAEREDRKVRLTLNVAGEEQQRELAIHDYRFEEIEAGAMVDKLCSLVPEPYSTAFRLRVVEELSYEEIAARTGAPVNTVATRIFKARWHLAKALKPPKAVRKNLAGREEVSSGRELTG